MADHFVAWAEIQMVGVAEDDLGIEIADQIAGEDALHCGLSTDRHEHRGLDVAVSCVEHSRARAGLGTDCLKLKAEH